MAVCHTISFPTEEQLAAECAEPPIPWIPSSPPADFNAPSRPASANATRKSRAAAGGSALNPGYNSAPRSSTPVGSGGGSGNEAFFERLGNANASRRDDVPPSQGGKYAGFGSDFNPGGGGGDNAHPSYGMSSHAMPSLNELQSNPLGALSKGWGLFSSAVKTSAGEINRSVVQPGMARAQDLAHQYGQTGPGPAQRQRAGPMAGEEQYENEVYLDAQGPGARAFSGLEGGGGGNEWERYLKSGLDGARAAGTWAGQRANEGWSAANELAKTKGGVDLNEQMNKLGLGGKGVQGQGGDAREKGYGQMKQDEGDDDFFDSWDAPATAGTGSSGPNSAAPAKGARGATAVGAGSGQKGDKKNDGWAEDEWKDF